MVSIPFSNEITRSSNSGESQSFITRPSSQRIGVPEAGLEMRVDAGEETVIELLIGFRSGRRRFCSENTLRKYGRA